MSHIWYDTVNTPIGELLLATTEQGLVRIAFKNEDFDFVLRDLEREVSRDIAQDSGMVGAVASELEEYFLGIRKSFQLPIDYRLSKGFRRAVHEELTRIPFGEQWTYKQLAEAVHNPRAVRAVGTACGFNPIPIVIPCHRIIRSDGSFGRYRGGEEVKKYLLHFEENSLLHGEEE